jgi:hypothetical protein
VRIFLPVIGMTRRRIADEDVAAQHFLTTACGRLLVPSKMRRRYSLMMPSVMITRLSGEAMRATMGFESSRKTGGQRLLIKEDAERRRKSWP